MTYRYRLLPGGYVDETGVHRGVPPTQEDFDRIVLVCAHRTLFKEGPIKPRVHDPLPTQGMSPYMLANHIFSPYDAEITQELPIEEAKKRWPNTPIRGPHLLTDSNDGQDNCGGPGLCKWCDESEGDK
jgi:hypothetical protein